VDTLSLFGTGLAYGFRFQRKISVSKPFVGGSKVETFHPHFIIQAFVSYDNKNS